MRANYLLLTCALTICAMLGATTNVEACTRCVYLGPEGNIVVARSLDWAEDPGTNFYLYPRGMERNGATGPNTMTWTSKYGSLVGTIYDVATIDGMNEKGLVANVLYLVESDYGTPQGNQPTMSIGAWAQYVLDNFASVDEAVGALSEDTFALIAPLLPNGDPAQGHLAISDPSGDSAIFEYIDGKLVIHHGREYQVMTNSPTYGKQLALDAYWEQVGGDAMLPGTHRASDRFVRATFYVHSIPQFKDMDRALASMAGVIRSVSVPLGITTPGEPNIASTFWRTLYDQKNNVLYFDSAISPSVFWVPLDKLDFSEGAPVKKLATAGDEVYYGDAADKFEAAEPFKFLTAGDKK